MRERYGMSKTRLFTAAELERSPEYERYELVEGRLVPMTHVGYEHARVVARVIFLLQSYLEAHPIGAILPELGVRLASDPDTVLGPDVAFIDQRRLQSPPRGFWPGAPDVARELRPGTDRY